MSRITQIIETLEAEKADLQRRLDFVEGQIDSFREHEGADVPKRSARRQTARRASSRRATARTVRRDLAADVIEYVTKHPGSTAGDVAKGINANRNSVATKLSQLAKAGEIVKADRGYGPAPVKR